MSLLLSQLFGSSLFTLAHLYKLATGVFAVVLNSLLSRDESILFSVDEGVLFSIGLCLCQSNLQRVELCFKGSESLLLCIEQLACLRSLLSIYMTLLVFWELNIWKLFLLGIPGQLAILLWFRMYRRNTKEEKDG